MAATIKETGMTVAAEQVAPRDAATHIEIATVNELFLRVARSGRKDAMLVQGDGDVWRSLSSEDVYTQVRALARAFQKWGLGRGERIAILSETRFEWAITDFAALAIGAVDVPIYPTLPALQIGELLRDSGARAIVVSTVAQYEKIALVLPSTAIEYVVLMDTADCPAGVVTFESLQHAGAVNDAVWNADFDALVESARPEDLATLIYTSGTTGEPKGVLLTHGNLASNTSASTRNFGFGPHDSTISYLPLSHITARALDYAMYFSGARVAYLPQFERLIQATRQVRPTVFVGVPRVYEKIRQGVEQKSAGSPVKRRILGWAVRTGARFRHAIHDRRLPRSVRWRVANRLVYGKIREAFGGCVTTFISGGAPLGMDTGDWFASVGISVLEGYGLTETSPVVAINTPVVHRMGSVGKPLQNLECRLAADGELLVRGPGILQGYWREGAAVAESSDGSGWFATGDIARFDEDGFLYITDRKKELLKTSGGKSIAPQPIESKLKSNVLVAQAALVGDKHKFISAVLSPNFTALESWAAQHGISACAREALVVEPRVIALYSEIMESVNSTLANFEAIKRFRLVAEEWTQETGELTPSMKLKRRVITERYAALIAGLYADEATAHGESA